MLRPILIASLLSAVFLLAACGSDDASTDSPTATAVPDSPASSPTASPSAENPASTAAVAVSSPSTGVTETTDAPAEYTSVDASENDESFPTPDIEQKQREMLPTAVIVEGEYPYPTANSTIDSDADGFYTIPELEQALRETYPSYVWPEAYHPTIDDIFVMTDFHRIPEGAEFQVPMELTFLGGLHQCAWEQNWIDAFSAGDQEAMDMSMQRLRATALTNPNSVHTIPHDMEMFNQAELGDPALLIRHIELNCLGFNR